MAEDGDSAARHAAEHCGHGPTGGPPTDKETVMNRIARLLQALVLSLALAGAAIAAPPAERVNINSADAATLDRVLLNIGPSKAQAIVAYRKANGPFRSIDQLALVKGVGLKTIEKNRDRIVLGGARPAAPRSAGAGAGRAPARAALQR